jgi:hypothetical protein
MTTKPRRKYTRSDDLPIYEHRRFRCPRCESLRMTNRSKRDADGVATQRRKCLTCGHEFFLIVE